MLFHRFILLIIGLLHNWWLTRSISNLISPSFLTHNWRVLLNKVWVWRWSKCDYLLSNNCSWFANGAGGKKSDIFFSSILLSNWNTPYYLHLNINKKSDIFFSSILLSNCNLPYCPLSVFVHKQKNQTFSSRVYCFLIETHHIIHCLRLSINKTSDIFFEYTAY